MCMAESATTALMIVASSLQSLEAVQRPKGNPRGFMASQMSNQLHSGETSQGYLRRHRTRAVLTSFAKTLSLRCPAGYRGQQQHTQRQKADTDAATPHYDKRQRQDRPHTLVPHPGRRD